MISASYDHDRPVGRRTIPEHIARRLDTVVAGLSHAEALNETAPIPFSIVPGVIA